MLDRCIKGWIKSLSVIGVLSGTSLVGALSIGPSTAQAQQNKQLSGSSDQLEAPGDPNQVPTARYGRGEPVDLSLIVEEWRGRYPATPVFSCICNAATCGDASEWPFRTFTLYQPFVALGQFNAASNEASGFNCFDMQTGDRP